MEIKKKHKHRIKAYLPLLQSYIKADSDQRRKGIHKMNKQQINTLCECVLNILYNKDTTTKKQRKVIKKYLKPYETKFKELTTASMCTDKRKTLCCYLRNCIAILIELLYPCMVKTSIG